MLPRPPRSPLFPYTTLFRSQLAGSYTWGKTIDTGSGSMVGDEYTNSISSPLFFNLRLNRGLADFNVSHSLSANYTWELGRSEEHTSELQSRRDLVCRLLLEK